MLEHCSIVFSNYTILESLKRYHNLFLENIAEFDGVFNKQCLEKFWEHEGL